MDSLLPQLFALLHLSACRMINHCFSFINHRFSRFLPVLECEEKKKNDKNSKKRYSSFEWMTLRRVTDFQSSNNIIISILALRGACHAFRTSINSLLYNFLSVTS